MEAPLPFSVTKFLQKNSTLPFLPAFQVTLFLRLNVEIILKLQNVT